MFQVGELVQLKSGGPKMTVSNHTEDGRCICIWFNKDEVLQTEYLNTGTLKRYEEMGLMGI